MTAKHTHKAFTPVFVLAEKVFKMATYLASSILLARLAGPEVFGQYSSLLALAVVFTVVSALGLNGLLVREFVRAKNIGQVFINAIALRLQGATVAVAVMIIVAVTYLDIPLSTTVIASLLLPITVFQIADSLFESRLELGRVLTYKSIGYGMGLTFKVIAALFSPNLLSLILAHLAEMIVILVGAALAVKSADIRVNVKSLDHSYQLSLLRKSLPLIMSSVAVILYMKVDLPMILAISGPDAAGIYAGATRICEALFILSTPIIVATFPKLVRLHKAERHQFNEYMRKVFVILLAVGTTLFLFAALMSDTAVNLMYGPQFAGSAEIIRIYAISIPIVFIGDLFSRWLIVTDNLKLSLYRHLFGLATNVCLNFTLIPIYGPAGAAYASVTAYFVAVILFASLNRRARLFFDFVRTK